MQRDKIHSTSRAATSAHTRRWTGCSTHAAYVSERVMCPSWFVEDFAPEWVSFVEIGPNLRESGHIFFSPSSMESPNIPTLMCWSSCLHLDLKKSFISSVPCSLLLVSFAIQIFRLWTCFNGPTFKFSTSFCMCYFAVKKALNTFKIET